MVIFRPVQMKKKIKTELQWLSEIIRRQKCLLITFNDSTLE